MTACRLVAEPFVMVQPSVVRAVGAGPAIVLQHVYYRVMGPSASVREDGARWAPVLQEDIAEETGLSTDAVYRAIRDLERKGILCYCQPDGNRSRRKWYRVDVAVLEGVTSARVRNRESAGASAKSSRDIAGSFPIETRVGVLEETKAEPAQLPNESDKAPDASRRSAAQANTQARKQTADHLTKTWWESHDPAPAMSFVGARKVVERMLVRFDEICVRRALARAGPRIWDARMEDLCRGTNGNGRGRSSNFEATKAVMERMRNGEC